MPRPGVATSPADLGLSPLFEKLDVLFIAVAAIAAFGAVWAGELWLSNDGPQHLFAGFATVHYQDPTLGYSRYLELNVPPTSLGYQAIFTTLEPLTGWRAAHRLTLAIAVELWGFGFVALVSGFSRRRRLIGVLGFSTAFHLAFFIGLIPFTVGSALGMFALAAWLRLDRLATRVVVTSMLLYFAARAHVVAAAIAGLLLAVLVLLDEREALRTRALALALCGLPALAVAFEFILTTVMTTSAAPPPASTVEAPPEFKGWVDRLFRSFQVGPLWRGGSFVALSLFAYFLSLRAPRRVQVLALAAVVLCFISMSLPRDLLGWQLAGSRFLPLPSMTLLALIAIERLPRSRATLLALLCLTYAGLSLAWAWHKASATAEQHRFAIEPIDQLTPNPRWLAPAVLSACLGPCDDEVPDLLPGFHLGQLYAVKLGGEAAFGHASARSMHHVLHRLDLDTVPPPDPQYWHIEQGARRERLLQRLPIWLSLQEAVLLVGKPEELQRFRDAGYLAERDTGRVFLGTFEGCSGRVEVEGGAGKVAHVGAWPLKTSAVDVTLDADGAAQVERIPCGGVWLLVDDLRCAGAEPGLPLRTTWRHGEPGSLSCALTPPPPAP